MFYDTMFLKDNEIMLRLIKTTEADLKREWLPAYYFDICLLDGTKIGYCDFRVGYNNKVYIGGNIGYGIDEPYRGHRYASKACKLLFELAKKHNMNWITISCQPENIASARTCEIAGGKFVEIAPIPENNDMYQDGKRFVKIYRFDFEKID